MGRVKRIEMLPLSIFRRQHFYSCDSQSEAMEEDMTREVIIKSNRYGINLILDAQVPFQELLAMIGEKFRETGNFFKDARMAVSFEGRELTTEEELKIADVIMENCSIQIVSIIDNNKETEELMRQRVEAAAGAGHQERPPYQAASVQPQVYSGMDMAGMDMAPTADFFKGNLRSGQTLECASSVTLIGDVNPGAKIISNGNIVVLGSMKGNAHAGAAGDSSCFIFALDMRPIQLQIGEMIAKSPDKEKEGWRGRKKAKAEGAQYTSRIAVIRDGYICIEPLTKESRDQL